MKKRLLSLAIVGAMLGSLLAVPAIAKEFPDSAEHWAEEAINVWSDRGVVNGDDAGNFRPGDPITRAETAKLMDNLIGFQKTSNKVFSDVTNDAWYASSVNKLYAAEVLTGYEDGTIRPGNSISRQEAAVIIGRAFALDTKKIDTGILSQFADNDQIQDWAKPVVAFMATKGFIQGSDGMFRPGDPITRAEIVTILNNMVGIYADGSQNTYTGDYGDKIAIVKAPTIFNGVTLGGAVVCGTTKGKVNFNSGSKVNGCICNWAPNASVSTAGATVASTANRGGGSISAGANVNVGYTGGSAGGGGSVGGGSVGGGNSSGTVSSQHTVTFLANGGTWTGGATQNVVTYTVGNSYALRLPLNPTRSGYIFEGWYTDLAAANTLNPSRKLVTTDLVTGSSYTVLYAGWKVPSGLYGTVDAAVGDNVADRGKSATELMDNVTLETTSSADVYQAKGGLRYLEEYPLGPNMLDPVGNYLALTYTLPDNLKAPHEVTITSKFSDGSSAASYGNFSAGSPTYTRVFKIEAADLAKDIIFTVDLDGSGLNIGTITVDLASLIRYQFVTVSTPEAFAAAAINPAAEKITVDAPLTLASGTYGSATGKKTVIMNHPVTLAKDSVINLQSMDITIADQVPVLFLNATELPAEEETPAPIDETDPTDEPTGEPTDEPTDEPTGEPTDGPTDSTPVPTKVTGLMLSNISIKGAGAILDTLLVKELVIKNLSMTYLGDSTATAISLSASAEGDKVSITQTTWNGYDVALAVTDDTWLDGVSIKNNLFLNNTTDIKLGVATAIPNISYNYFDQEPVLLGTEGAITNYLSPLYADETMKDSALTENLHDAFLMNGDEYLGKLSELTEVAVTFETEDAVLELTLVPTDLRNTNGTINQTSALSITLGKADLPKELTITIGGGMAKTITVTEATVND